MSAPYLALIATPLGNLEDLSPRAAAALATVGWLYAEDTRRSRQLLSHLGLRRRLHSLHAHNERSRTEAILAHLAAGDSVGLVTDAGTPVVSDPGAEVVAAVHAAGFQVTPIAGPSALTAALSVAGFMVAAPVQFHGFLPARGSALTAALAALAAAPTVAVFFESPRRLATCLARLAELQPAREAVICRELTKLHEEVRRGPLAALAAWAAASEVRGEITVVLGPGTAAVVLAPGDEVPQAALGRCLAAGLSPRDAATAVAAILELPRRAVYRLAHDLR